MKETNPLHSSLVASILFFPRPDTPFELSDPLAEDMRAPVDNGISVRLRVFRGQPSDPCILFFHGNGETASDYDPMSYSFKELPATLVIAEYRGYGPSDGLPSLETFLGDAHKVFDYVDGWLEREHRSKKIVVMGRSLGSAPAIELALSRSSEVCGLIVESGFARFVPLLERLGVSVKSLGIEEENGPENALKIAQIELPTLVIHGERDEIIPLRDAEELYRASRDPAKRMVTIPNAGHNDIHYKASDAYFTHLRVLMSRLTGS